MPVDYVNCESEDFEAVKYVYNLYTKLSCTARSLLDNTNIFEADEILPGLYIGSFHSVYDKKKLKSNGITRVISVIEGFVPPYPNDFEYLVINAIDNHNSNLIYNFEITNRFINDAFENCEKVLVHCMAGRSRSATIVAAYMIDTFGINVDTTLKLIKTQRPIVEPNLNYKRQLRDYFNILYNDTFEDI